MNLIATGNSLNILNISKTFILEESSKIPFKKCKVSINNFDRDTFGIVDNDAKLSILSLSGDNKSITALNSNIDCFSFFNNSTIIAGESSGNILMFDISKNPVKSKTLKNQIKNDGIHFLKLSRDRSLIYCLHKSGKVSTFNTRNRGTTVFKYNQSVTAIDVNDWSDNVSLLGSPGGYVATYDSTKECMINYWTHHKQDVTGVAFSMQNKLLALSISKDRSATVLGSDSKTVVNTYHLPNVPLSCAFGEDSLFAVGDDAGVVYLFDIRSKRVLNEYKTNGKVSFIGFNCPTIDRSNLSKESRVLRNLQNITNRTSSNNSVFSVDGSMEARDATESSFELSELGDLTGSSLSCTSNVKPPKKVNFQDSFEASTNIKVSTPKNVTNSKDGISTIPSDTPILKCLSSDTVLPDTAASRRIFTDEVKRELNNFEIRIKNDLLFSIIDQLSITENNILGPFQTLVDVVKSLKEENELLRQELRKYKYNV